MPKFHFNSTVTKPGGPGETRPGDGHGNVEADTPEQAKALVTAHAEQSGYTVETVKVWPAK
jgi:hypothetical protein